MSQTRREILLQNRLLKGTNPATRSLVLGGTKNAVVGGAQSSVLAGKENKIEASRYAAVVSGESNSVTSSDDSVTVGGLRNTLLYAPGSVSIGGGLEGVAAPVAGNSLSFTRNSTMLAGYDNTIQGGYQAGIMCAWESEIDALSGGGTTQFSTISGGSSNEIRSANSGILGGHSNVINESGYGWNAIVGGGENTMANSQFSAIVGAGGLNSPTQMTYANRCVIIGGGFQSLTGTSGSNTENSAILGGTLNSVTHSRSVAIGGTGLSSDATDTVFMSKVHIDNLPTSSAGLSAGTLWASGTSPNKYVRMA